MKRFSMKAQRRDAASLRQIVLYQQVRHIYAFHRNSTHYSNPRTNELVEEVDDQYRNTPQEHVAKVFELFEL